MNWTTVTKLGSIKVRQVKENRLKASAIDDLQNTKYEY